MTFTRVVPASLIPLLVSGAALAQDGHMGGGMGNFGGMGWYGGIWLPVLAVIAVAALVIWFVKQKGK
jgi:uncharacterized membrane protein